VLHSFYKVKQKISKKSYKFTGFAAAEIRFKFAWYHYRLM